MTMERTPSFRLKRIGVWLARAAFVGLAGVVLLVALLWWERNQPLELPTPTGPFAVGRVTYDWTDDAKLDTLAPVPGTKRELLVWVWYPSAVAQSAPVDDYVPAQMRAAAGPARGPLSLVTRDVSKVRGHSVQDADVSPQQPSYPVVIMRAGASAGVVSYSTLAEDLASHGYVVVGFDAPYRTGVVAFPDGRVMTRRPENNPELVSGEQLTKLGDKLLAAWTADVSFVLERLQRFNASDPSGKLTGRLDMTRVGVFGHSFGGATAAQFCSQDSRCQAGIDVDGSLHCSVIQAGIHKPFLFVLSGYGDFSSDSEVRQILADIQSVYDRLPADGRLRVVIRGANHFTFSDDGVLLKSHLLRGVLRAFGQLGMDADRQLEVTAHCLRTCFDAYLKPGMVLPPKITSTLYPEIQVVE